LPPASTERAALDEDPHAANASAHATAAIIGVRAKFDLMATATSNLNRARQDHKPRAITPKQPCHPRLTSSLSAAGGQKQAPATSSAAVAKMTVSQPIPFSFRDRADRV
jgi:hypothetical protein